MKKLIPFVLFLVVIFYGCKKDDDNPVNPGGGGTLGGSVAFQATVLQEQGQFFILFKPNKSVTLDRVIISLPAQSVLDTVNGDGTTVWDTTGFRIGPSPIPVVVGQQWVFTVQGKIGSPQGQAYSTTVNVNVTNIGGGGNITFTVAVVQNQQQETYFEFKPSTDFVLTQIQVICTQLQIDQTIPGDATVYGNAAPLYLGPVTGLQTGQQWSFVITGKLGSAQGQDFNVTVPYTIP